MSEAKAKRNAGSSASPPKDDWMWTETTLCHRTRRRKIQEAHPEVEELSGYDIRAAILSAATMALQIYVARYVGLNDLSWWLLVPLTYLLSSICEHSMFFAVHEASHNTLWPTTLLNRAHGIMLNVGMTIPVASSFFFYHRDHHVYQGVDDKDPDLPSRFEAQLWKGKVGKALFVICSPLSYTLRPFFIYRKAVDLFDIVTFGTVFTTNAMIIMIWGPKAFFYLLGGSLMGFSIHPLGGHLVAEHFQFPWGEQFQETFSYYGPLNIFAYNVGYHTEHHDFPMVPGFKLPLVRKMAPEFYNNRPHHDSWPQAIWEFITNDNMTVFSRVRRHGRGDGTVAEVPTTGKLIYTYDGDSSPKSPSTAASSPKDNTEEAESHSGSGKVQADPLAWDDWVTANDSASPLKVKQQ